MLHRLVSTSCIGAQTSLFLGLRLRLALGSLHQFNLGLLPDAILFIVVVLAQSSGAVLLITPPDGALALGLVSVWFSEWNVSLVPAVVKLTVT